MPRRYNNHLFPGWELDHPYKDVEILEGRKLKEIDQSRNHVYGGSTRFTFDSLLQERKTIGDDFVTRLMIQESEEPEQTPVTVNKGSVPNAATYYSGLRGFDRVFGVDLFQGVVSFTDQLTDPKTYAEFLATLGIAVDGARDMTSLEPEKLAASIHNRHGRIMESSADRCVFLVYFPSQEIRDQAFKAFQDEGLVDPLMMYPYEELSGDPEDEESEDLKKVIEFSLPRTRRTESQEESKSRARNLLEKTLGPAGYLRFVLY